MTRGASALGVIFTHISSTTLSPGPINRLACVMPLTDNREFSRGSPAHLARVLLLESRCLLEEELEGVAELRSSPRRAEPTRVDDLPAKAKKETMIVHTVTACICYVVLLLCLDNLTCWLCVDGQYLNVM